MNFQPSDNWIERWRGSPSSSFSPHLQFSSTSHQFHSTLLGILEVSKQSLIHSVHPPRVLYKRTARQEVCNSTLHIQFYLFSLKSSTHTHFILSFFGFVHSRFNRRMEDWEGDAVDSPSILNCCHVSASSKHTYSYAYSSPVFLISHFLLYFTLLSSPLTFLPILYPTLTWPSLAYSNLT